MRIGGYPLRNLFRNFSMGYPTPRTPTKKQGGLNNRCTCHLSDRCAKTTAQSIQSTKKIRSPQKAFWGRNLRMAQSRRHKRPRSSRLQHSASFRAMNPNKASMTLMLAAASICATDALERHLAPPGCFIRMPLFMILFFFKQKTAYEVSLGLVGSEMCIRDRH